MQTAQKRVSWREAPLAGIGRKVGVRGQNVLVTDVGYGNM